MLAVLQRQSAELPFLLATLILVFLTFVEPRQSQTKGVASSVACQRRKCRISVRCQHGNGSELHTHV